MSKAAGRQETRQGMVSMGMNPNDWVGDIASGVVGVANAASSYGQAKAGMSPEQIEAQKRQGVEPETDNTPLLLAAGAAAYFLTKK